MTTQFLATFYDNVFKQSCDENNESFLEKAMNLTKYISDKDFQAQLNVTPIQWCQHHSIKDELDGIIYLLNGDKEKKKVMEIKENNILKLKIYIFLNEDEGK